MAACFFRSAVLENLSIGELTGKRVAFVTASAALPEICIYDVLTDEQKQSSVNFLRQHQALVDQMFSTLTALYHATTQAEALAQLDAIDAVARSMQNVPIPDVPLFAAKFPLLNKNLIHIFESQTSQYRTALLRLSPQAPAAEVQAAWGGNGSLIDLRHREHSDTVDYVIRFAEALGVIV